MTRPDIPRRSRYGRRIKPQSVVARCATIGALALVAVPAVEAFVLWRTERPWVPGPHHQNGIIGSSNGMRTLPLVWLGDSLASGVGADNAEAAFPRRAASLYCERRAGLVDLTCLAQPGARAADVLALQVPDAVAALGPGSVAVVTVGSNDVGCLTRPRRFRRDYALILSALLGTGATVVAVGLPDMAAAMVIAQPLRFIAGRVGVRADRHIQRAASVHRAHYVDIRTSPPGGTQSHEFLAADRWHPNNDTYHLWAERFAKLLDQVMGTTVNVRVQPA